MDNPLEVDPRIDVKAKGRGLWLRLPPALEKDVRRWATKQNLRLSDAMVRLLAAGLDEAAK